MPGPISVLVDGSWYYAVHFANARKIMLAKTILTNNKSTVLYIKWLVRERFFPHLNCHLLNHVEIKNIHIFGNLIKLAHISRTLDKSLLFVVTSFVETTLFLWKAKFLKHFKLTSNLHTSVILVPLTSGVLLKNCIFFKAFLNEMARFFAHFISWFLKTSIARNSKMTDFSDIVF